MFMDIRHFKLVKMVSEEGSLTKAAEKLHLSQSALSHQLRDLEQELSVSVFNRVNKKLILTQAGKLLLDTSHDVLNEIGSLKRRISEISEGERGTIRLSTECYTCYHWLPNIIKEFKKEYPNVQVEIKTDDDHSTVSKLLNGELDIVLIHHEPEDPNISLNKILDDELVTIFCPEHSFAQKDVILPSDFKDQTLITHSKDFDSSTLNQKLLKRYNIIPANIIYVQLTGAALEMVKANLGITVMPRWIISSFLGNGQLQHLSLTKNKLIRKWNIATLKDPLRPAYIDQFIKIMSSHVK